LTFAFDATGRDREQAIFAQDQMRVGTWTLNLGLRWDRYALVTSDSAVSPRVAVAWARPAANFVVRGSYDRTFQTPAFENLLLASAHELDALGDTVLRLPVQPSRGHFFEVGASKGLWHWGRLDLTHFRRYADNAADDDVLLNTGVSFPIAFRRSNIFGSEIKLTVPGWQRMRAALAYGHMRGVTELPITGGLFLEDDAQTLLAAHDRVPISQDQRHTARAQVSYRLSDRLWTSSGFAFNSGLPVEWDGDPDNIATQYGSRILDRVDFERQRVRAWWTVDLSVGAILYRGRGVVRAQFDVRNLANGLNLINFAGLFSGTAIAPPRSVAVRVAAYF
jgi:outer membrane receptor for Fe3+-dicitrate